MKKIWRTGMCIDPARAVTAEDLRSKGAIVKDDPSEEQVESIQKDHELWNLFVRLERGEISFDSVHSKIEAHLNDLIKDRSISISPIILATRIAAHKAK